MQLAAEAEQLAAEAELEEARLVERERLAQRKKELEDWLHLSRFHRICLVLPFHEDI